VREIEIRNEMSEITADAGTPVCLSVRSGATGRQWSLAAPVGVEYTDAGIESSGSFGGAAKHSFVVVGKLPGDYLLQVALRAPWRKDPEIVRDVLLHVE